MQSSQNAHEKKIKTIIAHLLDIKTALRKLSCVFYMFLDAWDTRYLLNCFRGTNNKKSDNILLVFCTCSCLDLNKIKIKIFKPQAKHWDMPNLSISK
jgi:hypothetical protein